MQQKLFIKNGKNQNIAVLIDAPEHPVGLAFIMHGLGGYKEQSQMQMCAETFFENNYIAVRFDTTNTIGESDGNYEDATTTNYYEDLEDVIAWAEAQLWYKEPFVLLGHSLGGICIALYAEKHPERVKAIAPFSTVVSGKLSTETAIHKREAEEWKRTGWQTRKSRSKPEMIMRLKWSHIEDRLKYDLLPHADRLSMPVLFVVGEYDGHTPLEHQKMLYENVPGKKELHIIKGAEHTFREKEHLDAIKKILDHWIKSLK